MVHSRALQRGPEDGPHSADGDSLDAAELVADPAAEQAAAQGAQVVDRNDAALQERVGDDGLVGHRVDVAETHEVDVVLGVVDAAHHALVIAEEEDGQGGDAVDGDEQLPLLEEVGDIEAGETLHHDGGGYRYHSCKVSRGGLCCCGCYLLVELSVAGG